MNQPGAAIDRRPRFLSLQILAALLWSIAAPSALGWNKAGHMVTGAVAYQVLKQTNGPAVEEVIRLSRRLPSFAIPASTAAVNAEAMTFMYLARWPDDIRTDERLSHPKWHYIDLVYTPGESEDGASADVPEDQRSENILTAFKDAMVTLTDRSAPDEARAIALAWVMHLSGDVHQPLHTTSLRDTDHPEGDRGGNSDFVRASADGTPINLHDFWDGVVISSEQATSVRARAIWLWTVAGKKTQPESLDLATLPDTFERWARDESYGMAIRDAYDNGSLPLVGKTDQAHAPVLSPSYLRQAKTDGNTRVALAGERLAAILAAAFSSP